MTNKAIFLDRDGTINVDKDYVYKLEDLELIPNVVEGLKKLWIKYKLIIVTNQSGISRGYYTEQDYLKFRAVLHEQLLNKGAYITKEYFCPHVNGDNCNCRKPRTGMLEQAAKDLNLDLRNCWMIGDHLTDIQTGKNAGCRTIHVLTGHTSLPIKEADFEAKNMVEAADYICIFDNKNK